MYLLLIYMLNINKVVIKCFAFVMNGSTKSNKNKKKR